MRFPSLRLLSVAVLLAWMTPSVVALSVAVHLALDHHAGHGAAHATKISDLAAAAAHGHHHDVEATADHEHTASVTAGAPVRRPGPNPVAVLAPSVRTPTPPSASSRSDGSLRRGPPDPLFTTHCRLLL